ncbi:FmdE family protein [Pusillimonas sp.]|uniref:FmdE family protein n=1 Tax=Pusillimonas sp. TaxID=3040095 RepID=UPI0037C670F3
MAYPSFFDQIPTITLRDPLSRLLGSAEDGLIEYSYAEVVKLTGHSCPTVAGAWLMTTRALKRLYGDEAPTRGGIAVSFRNSAVEGVTGVIASVAGFITGATTDTGFKGLRGQFDRRNLMHFEQPIAGEIRFERLDTGQGVTVSFNASVVPPSAQMMPQLFAALQADATPEQQAAFAETWQGRVRTIFQNADHPGLIQYH